jgi:hypothetical protein
MFTQNGAKSMAKSLRASLVDRNVSLSHSTCLEIVARQIGFADWNTLSSKLPAQEKPGIPLGAPETYLEKERISRRREPTCRGAVVRFAASRGTKCGP